MDVESAATVSRVRSIVSYSANLDLTEPADMYCEWIDACERANEEEASRILSTKKSTLKNSRMKSAAKSELRSEITA